MVEWIAGNRIIGTNTERLGADFATQGGWKELARTELGSANATVSVTGLPDKQYYMILCDRTASSGGQNTGVQLNGDVNSNYAFRRNAGASDNPETDQISMEGLSTNTSYAFEVGHLANLANKEKLSIRQHVARNGGGEANPPYGADMVGKWDNVSDAVSSYQWITANSTTFSSGSEVVVLGYDKDDTHTDNFWEELASVELTGTNVKIDSGTFTSKKYLWVQIYYNQSGVSGHRKIRLGDATNGLDSGSNYSQQWNINGGAQGNENTETGWFIDQGSSGSVTSGFINMFFRNNPTEEKLCIRDEVWNYTSGASTANIFKSRYTGKWAMTDAGINQVTLEKSSGSDNGTFGAGSIIKVWGSN